MLIGTIKRCAALAALLAVGFASRAQAQPAIEYKFNETDVTAPNTGTLGNAVDLNMLDANGNAADLHSADTLGVSGQAGDRAFDLTSAPQQGAGARGPVGAIASALASGALPQITFSGWFKVTSPIINRGRLFDGAGVVVLASNDTSQSGLIRIQIGGGDVASNTVYGTVGQWVFFAITYDSTMNKVQYYVGSKVANAAPAGGGTTNGVLNFNGTLYVGNRADQTRPFQGLMDNIRIYASALTQAQVEAIRIGDVGSTVQLPGAPTNLTALAGDGRVVLNWTAGANAATYTVQRNDGTNFTNVVNPNYIDTTVVNGTTYTYTVVAVNSAGTSGPSNSASATPKAGLTTLTGFPAATAGQTIDLTAEGTTDWSHWGLNDILQDHKAVGGNPVGLISYAMKTAGAAAITQYTDNQALFSWSDGTPTATADATPTGIFTGNNAEGFFFTVPADTVKRIVRVYVGGFQSNARLLAHLSDNSAADYVNSQVNQGGIGNTDGAHYYAVYTITYQAASAGQTLAIHWDQITGGNVTLQAASLAVVSNAPPAPALSGVPFDSQAILSWTGVTGADSYSLYRKLSTDSTYTLVMAGIKATTFTDTGLTNGLTYNYYVVAVNSFGASANSNVVAITPIAAVIGTGDGLYGTYYSGDAADFSPENGTPFLTRIDPTINYQVDSPNLQFNPQPWPAGVPHDHYTVVWTGQFLAPYTTSYVFQTISDDGTQLSLDAKDGNGLQVIVNNNFYQAPTARNSLPISLVAGQKYDVKLEYYQGTGGASAQLTYAINGTAFALIPQTQLYSAFTAAPPAPTNLTATGGSHLVQLAWTPAPTALSYSVYRGTAPGAENATPIASGLTNTAYTDAGLNNGTTYYYYVTGVNYVGASPKSNEASATPMAASLVLRYTFENGPSMTDPDPIKDFAGTNDGLAFGGDTQFTHDAAQGSWAGITTDATHYLALPDAFDFGAQFTFFTLVKLNVGANIQTILATNGSGGSTSGFALYVNDANNSSRDLVFETNQNASGTNIQTKAMSAPGIFPLGDGKYHAVAAVVNQATGVVNIYFDGTQVLTDGRIDNTFPTASGANRLGMFPSGDEIAVNSQFDDVRVYNGLLSTADVASLTSNSPTVSGRLALEGVNSLPAISAGAPLGTFHVSFRTVNTTTEVFGADVSLTPVGAGNPNGTFTISGVPAGTYDVAIKGNKSLRVVLPSVTVSGPTTLPDTTLPAGDADNNNIVDIGDFGILVNAYLGDFSDPTSGYDPKADFNYDGKDDIGDFGLLVNEFGTPGAP